MLNNLYYLQFQPDRFCISDRINIIGTLFRLPCTTAAFLRTANIITSAYASVTFRTKLKASFHFVAHKSYYFAEITIHLYRNLNSNYSKPFVIPKS